MRRTGGFVILAVAWALGLMFAFIGLAAREAPIEVYLFLLVFSGGVLILSLVDEIASFKSPSRSIFNHDFDSRRKGALKSIGIGMYFVGLTILGLIFMFPFVTEEGRALLNMVRLYGGTVGGVLFFGGLGLAIHFWRQRLASPGPTMGFIGPTFTRNQITDLRNGICPRCGTLMRQPPELPGDTSERWYCPQCAELFVVRT